LVHTEYGAITTVPSTKQVVEFAQLVESVGFSRIGIADTAPKIYHAVYPAVTACLLQTERIKVGPYVTNPVSSHWSVHSSSAHAFEELTPGRFFLGFGTGDGAVHSVGMRPATLAYFEDSVIQMRERMPGRTGIHMAFSGVKGMDIAGRLATELTIGTGLDVGALRQLALRAREARATAGILSPLRVWAVATIFLAKSESEVKALRRHVRGLANGKARFTLDFSFEGKNVPTAYQAVMRERLSRYDYRFHGKAGENPNAHMFDDFPEIQEYLVDRMLMVGTAQHCVNSLDRLIREAELDGMWISVLPPVGGKTAHMAALREAAAALRDLIAPCPA
jgi:alkanesulfonate monooxygenase SsuD/methylene tetrahydromethanopterin reductase-like flavin-dependent oxidoreductase (luciferase family)